MIAISLDKIVHYYGSQRVLNNTHWDIQRGRKVGLVGANGAGKSTLLTIIAGDIQPTTGTVFRHKDTRIGFLTQTPDLDPANTVIEEVLGADADVQRTERALRRAEQRMSDPSTGSDPIAMERAMAAYSRTLDEYERCDGYRHESRAKEALGNLGLGSESYNRSVHALSGGEKKLVGLAKLLAAGADTLLLDEPDNHLDLEAKIYLEGLISAFGGTVVIVSHDRYLLDQTVEEIAEVEDGRLETYQGNYSVFAVEKELRLLRQQQRFQSQQKEIARIEASIARFEHWASVTVNERHARQARSRRKMLERMDRIDEPVLERRRMDLDLGGWRGSKKVLEIRGLIKSFGGPPHDDDGAETVDVLNGVDLLVWHGERVGLLGPNGSGKSVLLRCILGEEQPTAGEIQVGPSIRVGYYAQEQETLDSDRSLVEEIRQTRSMYEDQAVAFLGSFLFPYDMAKKRVGDLSGGERSRLQMAKIMLSEANLLLLDEPTNNLDLPSCEVLERALDEFQGTVLVVSHDRYFLDRVVGRIVELEDGTVTEYPGDYTYYREKRGTARADRMDWRGPMP